MPTIERTFGLRVFRYKTSSKDNLGNSMILELRKLVSLNKSRVTKCVLGGQICVEWLAS